MKTISTSAVACFSAVSFFFFVMICALLNARGYNVQPANFAGLIGATGLVVGMIAGIVKLSELSVSVQTTVYKHSYATAFKIGKLSFTVNMPIIK
jgi:hypothetical protein